MTDRMRRVDESVRAVLADAIGELKDRGSASSPSRA